MAFEELKERQGVIWGLAPFENYVWLTEMHDDLVDRLDPKPGERWLDVATGTGEVAFRAAEAGAEVTASDLAPALIETAKRLGAERGEERVRELLDDAFELDFVERDCPQTGESGEWVWQAFLDTYGPSRALSNSLEPERRAELASTMAAFFEQYRDGDGIHQPRAYYVVLGTRR